MDAAHPMILDGGQAPYSRCDRGRCSAMVLTDPRGPHSFSTSSAIAMFRSSSVKKVRLRRHARIQRYATSTAPSTFALSRGLPGRAGTIARS
jgi:hypothetical protein